MSSSDAIRPFGFKQLRDPRQQSRAGSAQANHAVPDVEAALAEAREQGRALGYEEGVQRGIADQQAAVERLVRAADQAYVDAREFTRVLEKQIVELSLAIAAKVIEREVSSDPTVVLNVVRAAINEVQEATSVYVRVHPRDHALIEEHWHTIGRSITGEPIALVADERVEPGGCLIETSIGHVDGQLSTRLSQVTNLFDALIDGEPA